MSRISFRGRQSYLPKIQLPPLMRRPRLTALSDAEYQLRAQLGRDTHRKKAPITLAATQRPKP